MANKRLRKLTKKKLAMYTAMKEYLCIIVLAAKHAEISRDTHYKWLKKDSNYKAWIEKAKYNVKDFGEHCLLKLMKEGNPAAIIFFNKTINKDRGYSEKQDCNIHNDQIRIIVEDPYNNKK